MFRGCSCGPHCIKKGWASKNPAPSEIDSVLFAKSFSIRNFPPFVGLLLGGFSGDSVPLLNATNEFVALASDLVEVVVSEFSPLFASCPFHLFPLAFKLVPIHKNLL